ncbi:putative alcohol dehydrogenase [Auxenochlorella protothecoides]|uniref:Alcohol dehydrogenase 4 n=2 Tax=Auxenochlorella protothecoides TaxID=3075 RepID=A0A087SNS4_AUXPR|nr:putative alcohol dehydrogenase [Auxenochlorella protothecoides]KFM27378.1 putative alcohol dehydrogenase [Auxenochlorella protothecoides]RMZ54191.1 hypothetical protein APUTEX25_005347 [Auxenochlorella protothecoides]|eukprot:RMZ54191.1 hypothetical protein APUTEX25_005347 [Auxenochlorella protothecoides]
MLRIVASRASRARGVAARLLNSSTSVTAPSIAETVTLRAFTTTALKSGALPIPTGAHGVNYHNANPEGGYSFFMPRQSLIGPGALKTAGNIVKSLNLKKAMIVTDEGLAKAGAVQPVLDMLAANGVEAIVFPGAKPNPTDENVADGLAMLKQHGCDFIVSYGGGSSHDCAKGIAIVATNGGRIHDYEGVDRSSKPILPLVSVNTTAGTASEMTRFCIITDSSRRVKMAIVDSAVTPTIAVDDPELMVKMPAALTAATGMDALTHAVEAYMSTISNPVTDASALHAMKLISAYLRTAVSNGKDARARDMMSYAQFLAGMAFNSASLGYVHAMAHQLGGFYNLPHGVCNAVLLPVIQDFNASAVPDRFVDVGEALGLGRLSAAEAPAAVVAAIRELSRDVGIPANLEALGVKPEDFDVLAENSLKDACGFTNPRPATKDEIVDLFRKAYEQGSSGQAMAASA